MDTLLKSDSLSRKDSRRLEKSFFLPAPIRRDRKKLIFIFGLLCIWSLVIIFFVNNFMVVVLPRPKNRTAPTVINLLTQDKLVDVGLFQPYKNSKILANLVYLDIPFGKKSGFLLNFKDALDLSGARLVLLVKRPHPDFSIDLVLRDTRFFSNALKPITQNVSGQTKKTGYDKISFFIEGKTASRISLARINLVRFTFQQRNEESMLLFIKNVSLEKGGK